MLETCPGPTARLHPPSQGFSCRRGPGRAAPSLTSLSGELSGRRRVDTSKGQSRSEAFCPAGWGHPLKRLGLRNSTALLTPPSDTGEGGLAASHSTRQRPSGSGLPHSHWLVPPPCTLLAGVPGPTHPGGGPFQIRPSVGGSPPQAARPAPGPSAPPWAPQARRGAADGQQCGADPRDRGGG